MSPRLALVVALALVGACAPARHTSPSPDSGLVGPEGGVLHFDAAMLPMPDAFVPHDGGPVLPDARTIDTGPPDAGTVDGATDRRLFVPDVPHTYDGTLTDPGVTILAHTIAVDPVLGGFTFLVAVRNTSTNIHLCAMDLTTRFWTASGTQIGMTQSLVATPPSRGVSGTGHLTSNCLLPGATGMQSNRLDLGTHTVDEIDHTTWQVGGINLIDSVATSDIGVSGVSTRMSFGQLDFVGTFENHSSVAVRFPEVWVFGLNAVGRPLYGGHDIDSGTVAARSTWSFDAIPGFTGTYASTVAFPKGSDS
jgi:hypothetical protein